MYGLTNVLVGATIVSGAIAATVPAHARLGHVAAGTASFKTRAKTLENFNGALSIYKTHLKYGAVPPPAVAALVANMTNTVVRRTTGSVVTSPIDSLDDAYDANVSIGTPAQVLSLDFDTGSSDLWCFSSETSASEINGQSIYTPSKSSTASKISGATWSITYGDGSSSSGDVYKDTVTIGGLTVTGQAVEAAKKVSSSFTSDSVTDGLVGLAFSSINSVEPTQQKTFFDNAKPQLNSPLFTADLKHQAAGHYNFGYIDTTAYTGSISYVSVDNSQGFWGFTSTINGKSVKGIADTGTTLIYLPDSVLSTYYSKISGAKNNANAGGYTFPCSIGNPPSFTFSAGSTTITVPGSYINFGDIGDGTGSCFGGIQSADGLPASIFGDVALKSAFVVFNGASSPQLGWATKTLSS